MAEPKQRFAVMLIIETNDPRLHDLDAKMETGDAGAFAKARRAILQRLPKDVVRVVAVFPEEHAKLLMQLHEAIGTDIAQAVGAGDKSFVRPPPDYIPPTTE